MRAIVRFAAVLSVLVLGLPLSAQSAVTLHGLIDTGEIFQSANAGVN